MASLRGAFVGVRDGVMMEVCRLHGYLSVCIAFELT